MHPRANRVLSAEPEVFPTGTVPDLTGKRIALLVADGFEQSELAGSLAALRGAGATAQIVSPLHESVQSCVCHDRGDSFPVDAALEDVRAEDFDALVLPGGMASADQLRSCGDAVRFVRAFFEQHKPVAAICHGLLMLVEADVVRGRRLTSWPAIRTDLENAGATWVDEPVVVDQGLVTSRKPDDMAAFTAKLLEEIAEGVHVGQHA